MIKGIIIVSMRVLITLLAFASASFAQGQAGARLWMDIGRGIGSDSLTQIRLVPTGCWEGLLVGARSGTTPNLGDPAVPSRGRRLAQATVEVWDFALPEEPIRHMAFRLFREDLFQSIQRSWATAPPIHGRIDLAIRGGDGRGGGNDMAMVQSLQQRFNRLPPNGSTVKPR